MVVIAFEGDALLAPQLLNQGHRLSEAREPFFAVWPFDAERHLVHGFASSEPEDDPAGKQAAERGEGLCHHGRVVAECRREHAGADDDPFRARAERPKPAERERRVPAIVAPRLQVVARKYGVEAHLLRKHAESQQVGRGELFG